MTGAVLRGWHRPFCGTMEAVMAKAKEPTDEAETETESVDVMAFIADRADIWRASLGLLKVNNIDYDAGEVLNLAEFLSGDHLR